MNNEPVAWMMKAREPSLHSPDYITFEIPTRNMKVSHHPYPLYTHPAELTDELLMELYEVADYSPESYLELARAILRKAQEK